MHVRQSLRRPRRVRPSIEGVTGAFEMVRVMMPVTPFELLDAHAEEARGLPQIRAELHLPGRGRMAKHVGRDVGQSGIDGVMAECLVDVLDRTAVPFDAEMLPKPFPAPQVRQESTGYRLREVGVSSSQRARLVVGRRCPGQDR
jgi:hypothetical protein